MGVRAGAGAAALWVGGCGLAEVPEGESRCRLEGRRLLCAHETEVFEVDGEDREVHWQVPLGEAPAEGWPVAMVFQGALFSAEHNWAGRPLTPFGGWHQVRLTQELLDGGFLVVTPEARRDGMTCWDTNRPRFADDWADSPDAALMEALFLALDEGDFGPVDPARWYAAGISSGGYMSSRVATEWPERFAAIAIAAGSYATCIGVLCDIPEDLPEEHPPTLFLHGLRDKVVPVWTALLYQRKLEGLGVHTDRRVALLAEHEWIAGAEDEVPAWFQDH